MSRPPTRQGLDPSFDVDAAPRVAQPNSLWPIAFGIVGAMALGTIVFLQLDSSRRAAEAAAKAPAPQPVVVQAPPVQVVQPLPEPDPEPPPLTEDQIAALAAPPPAVAEPVAPGPTQQEIDRLRAPALIIDLGQYETPDKAAQVGPGGVIDPKAITGAMAPAQNLNPDERFADRFGVGSNTRPAVAESKIDLTTTIVEGSIIPAVLETAINSDLPGYTRAVVSRDVRGFDGSQILVPRGSRLIGQYKSGVALGQSRTFVIWTRLIRPDGAAVELSAPATDGLGRGGLDGKVDNHFFQRFGGAILLTMLDLGVSAATDSGDTAIVIAGARAGNLAGGEVARDSQISPTVKVPQGSPVRVFVNQDLDFSAVGPVKPDPQ